MPLSFSTPLRNGLLTTGSFKSLMDGSVLRIYSGPVPGGLVPADAPLSVGNVLLIEFSVDGTGGGITWQAPAAGGAVIKSMDEVWEGTVVASGEPSFFRVVKPGDTGALAVSDVRVQGTAGPSSPDLVLTTPTLTTGDVRRLGFAQISLPPV